MMVADADGGSFPAVNRKILHGQKLRPGIVQAGRICRCLVSRGADFRYTVVRGRCVSLLH